MNRGKQPLMAWFRTHWRMISRVASACFMLGVIVLLGMLAVKVDWDQVAEALVAYKLRTLALAALFSGMSYLAYSGFDALGKAYTEHPLSWFKTMLVGAISYAFSMNLGSALGGAGLRLRLYTRLGLPKGTVMRVIGLSITTNWVGYFWLAGVLFSSAFMTLPEQWKVGSLAMRVIGVCLVLAGVAYLYLCATSTRRSWEIKGHEIELPSLKIAGLQVVLAMLNWSLMGAVIYVLLQQSVDYFVVLGLLLISAVAGIVVHMPAGLGVIETVFIGALYYSGSRSEILAALVAYRAVYYLIPLALSGLAFFFLEARVGQASRLERR